MVGPLNYIGQMDFGILMTYMGLYWDLEFRLGLVNFNLDQNWEKLMGSLYSLIGKCGCRPAQAI